MSQNDVAPVKEKDRGIEIIRFFQKFPERIIEKTVMEERPESVVEEVHITDPEGNPTGAVKQVKKTIMRSVPVVKKTAQKTTEDWVLYGPSGFTKYTQIPEAISHVRKNQAMWPMIEPKYNLWKSGQEIPEDGTPLAAWAGCSPEQADVLRVNGIYTVESLATATDGMLERIAFPGARTLMLQAREFLKAMDARVAQNELAARDDMIADLQAQMAELREQLSGHSAEPERRGPGRPKKEV